MKNANNASMSTTIATVIVSTVFIRLDAVDPEGHPRVHYGQGAHQRGQGEV